MTRLKHSRLMPHIIWEPIEGRVVKIEFIYPTGRRQLNVTFSYRAQGLSYEGKLYTFQSMNVGNSLMVKYDASNPQMTAFKAQYAANMDDLVDCHGPSACGSAPAHGLDQNVGASVSTPLPKRRANCNFTANGR